MANRRMLAKSLICSDEFLELSGEARLLYFHLSVEPDDDGFTASVRRTMRDAGVKESALQELIERGYILQFPNGVILLAHWQVNNRLRSDRYTPTTYKREFSQVETDPESLVYHWLPSGIPSTGEVSPDQASQDQASQDQERGIQLQHRGGSEGENPPPDGKQLFTPEEYQRLRETYNPERLDGAIKAYAKIASPYAQHYEAFRVFVDQSIPGLRLKRRDEA